MSDLTSVSEVVFLSNDVDRLGGISKFMSVLGTGFFNRGMNVSFIGIEPAREPQSYPRPEGIYTTTLYDSVPIDFIPNPDGNPELKSQNQEIKAGRSRQRQKGVAELRKLAQNWDATTAIIVTQLFAMEHFLETGIKFGINGGPRLFGQYHDSFSAAHNRGDVRRVLGAYPQANRMLALTEHDATRFSEAGLTNVSWMPNPIDIDPNHRKNSRRKTVISMARYHEQKSLHLLIEAWTQVANVHPDWTLELYGEGPERVRLESLIEKYSLQESVKLMGMTDEAYAVMGASRIHVLSSQHEGLPLAIAEANFLGTPTVAFNCAPGVEVMTGYGEAGVLVEQNNIGQLADSLIRVMGNEELLASFAEKAIALSGQFELSRILDGWEAEFLRASL